MVSRMDPPLHRPAPATDRAAMLRGVALLPAAATLGNLLCGVLACLCCLFAIRAKLQGDLPVTTHPHLAEWFPTHLTVGAYLIVVAMLFDALDGRLARLTRRTSEFGAQLDSIADIVSFGAAPVLLYLTLLLIQPGAEGGVGVSRLEWRFGLICALVYASCAAIRLARYNAENVKSESAQRLFRGLPTPGAAAALIALILFHESLAQQPRPNAVYGPLALRLAIGAWAFVLGMLMISRLDYVHVMNVYARRDQPPAYLVGLVILIALLWYWPAIVLVVIAFVYVGSGLVLGRRAAVIQTVAPSDDDAYDDDPADDDNERN